MQRWLILVAIVIGLLLVAWSGPSTAQAGGCQAFGQNVVAEANAFHPLGRTITEAGLTPLNEHVAAEFALFCS
jgi:hypothetical protein